VPYRSKQANRRGGIINEKERNLKNAAERADMHTVERNGFTKSDVLVQ
jgi:hypothetical protein